MNGHWSADTGWCECSATWNLRPDGPGRIVWEPTNAAARLHVARLADIKVGRFNGAVLEGEAR